MTKDLEIITPTSTEELQDILYSEVEEAIPTLKRKKSQASHGITAEMIQAGGEQLPPQTHLLGNKPWSEGTIPEQWSKSILLPIPKKGDLSQCANYRTVSLINHTGKILLIILLNIPPLTRTSRSQRRQKYRTSNPNTSTNSRKGKIYNCFIDFHKAFDTIKHKVMCPLLRSYGIEEKIVTHYYRR